ncbi:holo-ACP synthase [Chloroflexota bacterium]
MHHIGTDIIEVNRIRKALDRWGERFLSRIYTEPELKICKNKPERLASRFAGKEAVMKALGTGAVGVSWKEIEIVSEPGGKPIVRLYGKAREKADSLGLDGLAISLSDSKEYAVAFVVGSAA